MSKLQNILAYLCLQYPHKGELSNARITKLVYLADWFSALSDSKQLTNISWLFNHYGPYVDDIMSCAESNHSFVIKTEKTTYGGPKRLIEFIGTVEDARLSEREKQILDLVIDKTKDLYFNDFINYVYSTYPVQSKERHSILDLVSLAEEYKSKALTSVAS